MVEPQPVGEQPRQLALERIEPGERVFPDREQQVHRQLPPRLQVDDRIGERELSSMVDEVRLDLIEEEIHVSVECGGDFDRVRKRAGLDSSRGGDRLAERADRILGPSVVQDDERSLGQGPQVSRHTGSQDRALADAARPVQDREMRGDEIRRDHRPVVLAAEEQQLVELGILEWREPLVRAQRLRLHEGLGRGDAHIDTSATGSPSRRPRRS